MPLGGGGPSSSPSRPTTLRMTEVRFIHVQCMQLRTFAILSTDVCVRFTDSAGQLAVTAACLLDSK